MLCYEGASVLFYVRPMKVKSGFKLVFGFPNILAVITLVTKEEIDDVCSFACEFVPDGECFFSLRTLKCMCFNEMFVTEYAFLGAFVTPRL